MLVRSLLFAAVLAGLGASPALADVVLLKNGESLEGIVVSRKDGYLTLRVPHGEIGFDEALVESVDGTKGPDAAKLTELEEASRRASELVQIEREAAFARRAAIAAVEASATRETVEEAPAEPTAAESLEAELRARLDAIEATLAEVPTKRERVKLRRLLLNAYLGAGAVYDPILRVAG